MYVQLDCLTKLLSYYSVLRPVQVLENGNYGQLIISNISHSTLFHLLINMLSFYNFGKYFEQRLGSKRFSFLLLYFGLASKIIQVFISFMQHYLCGYNYFYYSGSLGFSCIVFSLRYLYYFERNQQRLLYGFLVKSKYIIWIELLLMTIAMPMSSFIGHLSGILASMLLTCK